MSLSGPISVFVADDHPVYLDGINRAIAARDDLLLVGAAADGGEALERIRALTPDVAVIDQHLPSLSGLDILEAARREPLPTRILILSGNDSSVVVYDAVRAGAAGFLTKGSTREVICEAIVAIARGETVLGAEIQTALAGEVRGREQREQLRLSRREREILGLIADGLTSPQIAKQLYVSTSTVKTHLKHLYEKLGVSDRAAAVAEAMRRGVLD